MTTTNKEDIINNNKKLLERLNNVGNSTMSFSDNQLNSNFSSSSNSFDAIDENKKLLEKLNSVILSTAVINENNSYHTPEFQEALLTEKTQYGSRIGSWDIKINNYTNNNKNIKTYDIINVHTSEPIAKDLYLYEVAYSLVRLFNKGQTLTSPKVKEILLSEEKYTRNRLDAISFRKRYNDAMKIRDIPKANIMESRYQKSKEQALQAKSNIKKLCENI